MAESSGDHNLTRTEQIKRLNDLFRLTNVGGQVMMTAGVAAMADDARREVFERVRTFDAFTPDNDPHGEHDFGNFEHQGHKIFWKIDYYDRTIFGTGRDMGSKDPSDPKQTVRVLTIMLAS